MKLFALLLLSVAMLGQTKPAPQTPEPHAPPSSVAIPQEHQVKLLQEQHQLDAIRLRAAAITQQYQQMIQQLSNQEAAAQKLYDQEQEAAYKAAKLSADKFGLNLEKGEFEAKPAPKSPDAAAGKPVPKK